MKQFYKTLFFTLILTLSSINIFSQVGAVFVTGTTGTMSGVPFTLSNFTSRATGFTADLTKSGFSAAPLSSFETTWTLENYGNMTVTFDSPISNLRLYFIFARTSTFELDQPFTILSGDTNFTNPTGNQISTIQFSDGIIEFNNPITTFNFSVISGGASAAIGITFGLAQTLAVEQSKLNNIAFFPNPTKDFLQITGFTEEKNFKIYNLLGAEILKGKVSSNKKIDVQKLKSGLYFMKIDNEKTFKFVKN